MLMKRLLRILTIFCVLQGLSVLGAASTLSQDAHLAGCRYFPGTGHNVQGEFLAFYDRFRGEVTLGQPRTEAFVQDGLTVQYFERARMELHPSNPSQYRVQLTLLGDLLGYGQPAIPAQDIPPFTNMQRRYYPQTGHTLSYVFLQYYGIRGGIDLFGCPITEMMTEGGTTVQYFERGKMEWHPENPIASQITLGSLGNECILRWNVNPQYLAPVASMCGVASVRPTAVPTVPRPPAPQPTTPVSPPSPGPAPQGILTPVPPAAATPVPQPRPQEETWPVAPPAPPLATDFSVAAAVKYRNTGQGGSQTIYVRVVDSLGQGIANAPVQATVHFQTGDVVARGSTDGSGSCSLTFNIGFPPPGYTVMIEVRVTHAGRTVTTHDSFMVWS